MAVERCDAVVRALSVAAPRRGALGSLFGGGLAGLISAPEVTAARSADSENHRA